MGWSKEEADLLSGEAWDSGDGHRGRCLAVATRAVELELERVRARGGTMTGEEHAWRCAKIALTLPEIADEIARHAAAQGARVAELEAGKATLDDLFRKYQDAFSAERRRAVEAEQQRDAMKAELARLKPSGQVAEDERRVRVVLESALSPSMLTPIMVADARDALPRLAAGAQERERLHSILAYIQECGGGPHLLKEAGALESDRRDEVREEAEALRARVKELEEEKAQRVTLYEDALKRGAEARTLQWRRAEQSTQERYAAEARLEHVRRDIQRLSALLVEMAKAVGEPKP